VKIDVIGEMKEIDEVTVKRIIDVVEQRDVEVDAESVQLNVDVLGCRY
jgi:hypothetical protein